MERDPMERTIVIKVAKKPHAPAQAGAAVAEPAKVEPAATTADEATRDKLSAIASLYRLLRG